MSQDDRNSLDRLLNGRLESISDYGDTPEQVDLHWFMGWGERLKSMIEDQGFTPGRVDWVIFRPDERARDAMIRFGGKFPQVIGQVREFLDHAESSFTDLCRLLPPSRCPSCESTQDFQDEGDDVWHCWICGERCKIPLVDQRRKEKAEEVVWFAYETLSRSILVAAESLSPKDSGKTKAATGSEPAPTNDEINAIRGVIDSLLPTRNPIRTAIRAEMKKQGIKLGNGKLAKILAILKKE